MHLPSESQGEEGGVTPYTPSLCNSSAGLRKRSAEAPEPCPFGGVVYMAGP